MIVAVFVATGLLAVAALLAVVRIERGPSMLDRSIAFDVLTSVLVGAIAVEAAWSRRTETIPILVVLSLVGFVGSVAIARFASVEPEGEGVVRSSDEIAAGEAGRMEALDAAEASHDAEHHGGGAEGEVR
ncbi:monovalent cation/H+ antiporter complex subunit F [Puerhibacterium puerhi]|uniref:monovalent cation/H+ antiporter complex subunit F n=1 Tax=Puerhibacterium puerhi TaxID=2692623 RepID=UPI00135ADCBB|nr:monovalent cation/H+ antiporter complex subunit F [Puerhibacterium puerhi]